MPNIILLLLIQQRPLKKFMLIAEVIARFLFVSFAEAKIKICSVHLYCVKVRYYSQAEHALYRTIITDAGALRYAVVPGFSVPWTGRQANCGGECLNEPI